VTSPLCKFPGCGRGVKTRGMCNAHYQQFRVGKPLAPLRRRSRGTVEERFDFYARKGEGCWIWTGPRHSGGYGTLGVEGEKRYAHRVSHELHIGPIPEGLVIDHICRNKICVNPDHLQAVTNKENGENLETPRTWNSSGVRGVAWSPLMKKWRARVGHNWRTIEAGYFDTIAEAEAAVVELRNRLHVNNLVDRE